MDGSAGVKDRSDANIKREIHGEGLLSTMTYCNNTMQQSVEQAAPN